MSCNSFFAPRANKNESRKAAVKYTQGKKRVFKHIDIADSDSEAEDDYVPPRNYDKGSDDHSYDNDTGPDDMSDDDLEEILKKVPEKSKLDRKRKIKKSAGKYERKKAKVATSKKAKGPHDRLREFPDNGRCKWQAQLSRVLFA